MISSNAKDKTQGTRGDQEAGRNSFNPNSSERIRYTGTRARCKPIGICRANWEESDSACKSPGGIISQLIEETEQEITDHETRVVKLHARLQNLRSLLEQLDNAE